MKRCIIIFLVCIMLLSLCACAGKTVTEDPTQVIATDPTVTTAPTETLPQRVSLQSLLDKRDLPALKSREEMLAILQTEVYGTMPAAPPNITFSTKEKNVSNFCNGKADLYEVTAKCTVNGKEFVFPFSFAMPKDAEKVPFFMFIGFTRGIASKYQPTATLIDNGYGILYFDYQDIASDDKHFNNGLSAILYPDGTRGDTDPGKIAMWAWGAHRLMDYAETVSDKLDLTRSIVCGHSRTGKAALLAGATDTRIQFTYSNNSGCTGAALSRGKFGETVDRVTDLFPYWFCKNYRKYANKESSMPFDQHYLLASIAPRKVLVGSGSTDYVADFQSEQLACLAASPAFEKGFACTVLAVAGEEYFEGDIGYHLREGEHAFKEEDWLKLIKFVNYHTEKDKSKPPA